MKIELGGIYRLIEDMHILNDTYGIKTGGSICKAGELFEVIDLPDAKKKKYTLYPIQSKKLLLAAKITTNMFNITGVFSH